MSDSHLYQLIKQLKESEILIGKLSHKIDAYKMLSLVLGSMVVILIFFR